MKEQEISNMQEQPNLSDSREAGSWLDNLPPEVRTAPSLAKFKDASALAQSYLEAEKALSSRVALPKEDSSDEEWSKFYAKLGLPENGQYLEHRVPEDEEYLKAYEDMFYSQGLSKRQGQKLLDSMYKFSQDLQKRQQEELERVRSSNTEWLKSNYGNDFDTKMTVMQAALSKFGNKELANLVEETSYAPALVDLLVKVGETLKSDSLVTGGTPAAKNDPKSALNEIKRLESDPEFMVKLGNKNHPGHESSVQKMEELYKIAYDK